MNPEQLRNPTDGLLWEEITASSLVKVRSNGDIVDNGNTDMPINPAGFKIHSAIHTSKRGRSGGDILWTMHTHTMETVAVSNMEGGFRPGLSQFAMDLGPVRLHEFEHATAGDHVCQQLLADLGEAPCKVLLMRNHGCLTVGSTVSECYFRLLQLIRACEVQVACGPLTRVVEVPARVVEDTFQITEANYTGEPFGTLEWRAAVRRMERRYGDAYAQ
jgi:ribulose-5-phosphate 4-epimerase/fuculose-1-phosphate aldolase